MRDKSMIIRQFAKISVLCCFLVLLLAGCDFSKSSEDSTESTESGASSEDSTGDKYDSVTADGMVSELMEDMSLEEMVGQMFIVSTDSLDYDAAVTVTEAMKEKMEKYQPGGIIYFSFNIESREQTKTFLSDAQAVAKIPLFLSVDEEGGEVARIGNNDKMEVTTFPDMATIGLTKDSSKAYEVGDTIGKEISELGFNLDYAPVADISVNDQNTEIGNRSFGSDPDVVADMVAQEVRGLQKNDVSATLKHFPGQGGLLDDTHKGYADLNRNIDQLRSEEFKPFKEGIQAGADFVMVSHETVESVTESKEPASLSSLIVSDILRDELHFDKIVITDAMNMKSITKFYDSDEAAVKAIQAGCDVILMPDDFETAYDGVLNAVNDGTLSKKRIKESVRRILKVKLQRGLIEMDDQG